MHHLHLHFLIQPQTQPQQHTTQTASPRIPTLHSLTQSHLILIGCRCNYTQLHPPTHTHIKGLCILSNAAKHYNSSLLFLVCQAFDYSVDLLVFTLSCFSLFVHFCLACFRLLTESLDPCLFFGLRYLPDLFWIVWTDWLIIACFLDYDCCCSDIFACVLNKD